MSSVRSPCSVMSLSLFTSIRACPAAAIDNILGSSSFSTSNLRRPPAPWNAVDFSHFSFFVNVFLFVTWAIFLNKEPQCWISSVAWALTDEESTLVARWGTLSPRIHWWTAQDWKELLFAINVAWYCYENEFVANSLLISKIPRNLIPRMNVVNVLNFNTRFFEVTAIEHLSNERNCFFIILNLEILFLMCKLPIDNVFTPKCKKTLTLIRHTFLTVSLPHSRRLTRIALS